MGIPKKGVDSMNVNVLLVVFSVLGGIDTILELIKKIIEIIKWVIAMVQKICNATKK